MRPIREIIQDYKWLAWPALLPAWAGVLTIAGYLSSENVTVLGTADCNGNGTVDALVAMPHEFGTRADLGYIDGEHVPRGAREFRASRFYFTPFKDAETTAAWNENHARFYKAAFLRKESDQTSVCLAAYGGWRFGCYETFPVEN